MCSVLGGVLLPSLAALHGTAWVHLSLPPVRSFLQEGAVPASHTLPSSAVLPVVLKVLERSREGRGFGNYSANNRH